MDKNGRTGNVLAMRFVLFSFFDDCELIVVVVVADSFFSHFLHVCLYHRHFIVCAAYVYMCIYIKSTDTAKSHTFGI